MNKQSLVTISLFFSHSLFALPETVINTNNSGLGSLRSAVSFVGNKDPILFAILEPPPHIIRLTTPALTTPSKTKNFTINTANNETTISPASYGLTLFELSGSSVTFSGNNLTLGDPSFGGTIKFTSNANTSCIFSTSGNIHVPGNIAGTKLSLTATGGGDVILSGVNTYNGITEVSNSTLILNSNLNATSEISVKNSSILRFGQSTSNNRSIKNNGTIDLSTTSTFSHTIGTISGNGDLIHSGTGISTLGGIYTYKGSTTISAGTLVLNSPLNSTSNILVGDGATLKFLGTSSNNRSITNDGTIDLATSSTFSHLTGTISGTGNLVHSGIGNSILEGTYTYTGTTTINNGTLSLNRPITNSSSISTSINGTLRFLELASSDRSIINNGMIDLGTPSTFSHLTGTISGSGGLLHSGRGTSTLNGTYTYTGPTRIDSGTVILNSNLQGTSSITTNPNANLRFLSIPSSDRSIINNGTIDLATSSTFSHLTGTISGSGGILHSGRGTSTLNGTYTYTGPTRIDAGTVILNRNLQGTSSITTNPNTNLRFLSIPSSDRSIINNGVIDLATSSSFSHLTGTISGSGRLVHSGIGTSTLSGTYTYTGDTIINAGILVLSSDLSQTSQITIQEEAKLKYTNIRSSNRSILNMGSIDFAPSAGIELSFMGSISGNGQLIQSGEGTTLLGGPMDDFSGEVFVDAGTLVLNSSFGDGALVDVSGQLSYNFTGTIENDINLSGGILRFDGPEGSLNIAGSISGIGSIQTNSDVSVELTGSNSFQGTIIQEKSNLRVNTDASSSTVLIGPSARLSGTGKVGNTTISGMVSPGNSIGTLFVIGDYSQTSGSSLSIEFDNLGNSSLVDITGSATISPDNTTLFLIPQDGVYNPGTIYTILEADNGITPGSEFAFITVSGENPLEVEMIYNPDSIQFIITGFMSSSIASSNWAITTNGVKTLSNLQRSIYDTFINGSTYIQTVRKLANIRCGALQKGIAPYLYVSNFNTNTTNTVSSNLGNLNIIGPVIGLDYGINDKLLFGFNVSCLFGESKETNNKSYVHSNVYGGTIYGQFLPGSIWDIEVGTGIAFSDYHTSRKGIGRDVMTSNTTGIGYFAYAKVDPRLCFKYTLFNPYLGIEYSYNQMQGYNEKGSLNQNLHVEKDSYPECDIEIGLHIAPELKMSSWSFIPYFTVAETYSCLESDHTITVTQIISGTQSVVANYNEDQWMTKLGGGFSFVHETRGKIFIDIDTYINQQINNSFSVIGGVGLQF